MNADLFANAFLKPCEAFREKIGVLMFEFSKFYPSDYQHGRDFVADLDRFLGDLPAGWPYAIEMRNKHFLHPEYFEALKRHRVAHVYNAWAKMPELRHQIAIPESATADFQVCRALLRRGRVYEEAVDAFQPYTHVQDPNPEARESMKVLIGRARENKELLFLFVNNRLEGNAPATILSLVE